MVCNVAPIVTASPSALPFSFQLPVGAVGAQTDGADVMAAEPEIAGGDLDGAPRAAAACRGTCACATTVPVMRRRPAPRSVDRSSGVVSSVRSTRVVPSPLPATVTVSLAERTAVSVPFHCGSAVVTSMST